MHLSVSHLHWIKIRSLNINLHSSCVFPVHNSEESSPEPEEKPQPVDGVEEEKTTETDESVPEDQTDLNAEDDETEIEEPDEEDSDDSDEDEDFPTSLNIGSGEAVQVISGNADFDSESYEEEPEQAPAAEPEQDAKPEQAATDEGKEAERAQA